MKWNKTVTYTIQNDWHDTHSKFKKKKPSELMLNLNRIHFNEILFQ